MNTMSIDFEVAHTKCCSCGCLIIMPQEIMNVLKASKRSFYCINGHGQSFVKSTEDILREEKEKLKNRVSELTYSLYVLKEELFNIKNPPLPVKRKANRIAKPTNTH